MVEALHTGVMANVSVGGESQNHSVLQMGSGKVVHWLSRSSPSSYQQCFTRLSETWGMVSTYSPDRTGLFNVAHFRAKTKTTRILMRELVFADGSAPVANSAEEVQIIVDPFSDASKKFGLKTA